MKSFDKTLINNKSNILFENKELKTQLQLICNHLYDLNNDAFNNNEKRSNSYNKDFDHNKTMSNILNNISNNNVNNKARLKNNTYNKAQECVNNQSLEYYVNNIRRLRNSIDFSLNSNKILKKEKDIKDKKEKLNSLLDENLFYEGCIASSNNNYNYEKEWNHLYNEESELKLENTAYKVELRNNYSKINSLIKNISNQYKLENTITPIIPNYEEILKLKDYENKVNYINNNIEFKKRVYQEKLNNKSKEIKRVQIKNVSAYNLIIAQEKEISLLENEIRQKIMYNNHNIYINNTNVSALEKQELQISNTELEIQANSFNKEGKLEKENEPRRNNLNIKLNDSFEEKLLNIQQLSKNFIIYKYI